MMKFQTNLGGTKVEIQNNRLNHHSLGAFGGNLSKSYNS